MPRRILVSILAWLACFLTLVACGAFWSIGGCTFGPHDQESTLSQGMASGAFLGMICSWGAWAAVFFTWPAAGKDWKWPAASS